MKSTAVLAALISLGFVTAWPPPSIPPEAQALFGPSPVQVPVRDDFEAHKDPSSPTSSPRWKGPSSPQSSPRHSLHDAQSPGWSVRSSPAIAPDVLKMLEDCYDPHADDQVFHGILPDTGVPDHSSMSLSQFKALQRSNPKITLDRGKAGAEMRFGAGDACKPIGLARVKTPFGNMEFHVLDNSSPTVLSYKDMRALGLEVRHRPARLVKVNSKGKVLAEEALIHQWQYPWYRPPGGLKCVRRRCSWLSKICSCLGKPGAETTGLSHARATTPGSPVESTPPWSPVNSAPSWSPIHSMPTDSPVNATPPESPTAWSPVNPTSPDILRWSPKRCDKVKVYSDDDQFFYGIVPDTGSSAYSSMGLPQFKALKRIKPDIDLDRSKAGAVRLKFGPEEPCTSIGLARVPTRFGNMKFHVMDYGIPTLLSYPDMRKLGLEVRNRPSNRLVKVDKSGNILDEEPLEEVPSRYGHPSYRYPWDCPNQPGTSHASSTTPADHHRVVCEKLHLPSTSSS